MTADLILESVFILNRRTGERAKRLVCAVQLLRAGTTKGDAVKQIQQRFGVKQSAAWTIVDMAADMALKGKP